MKRRDLVAGLALAGIGNSAEPGERESLYIPRPHLIEDREFLQDFMDEYSFVELITAAPGICVTHIPVLLDRNTGKYGTLYGHISRKNPQGETFDGRHPAVAVFRGPHSYISPTWYETTEAVPTWNFAVVHASGKPKAITEEKPLHDLLAKLVSKFENHWNSSYDFKESAYDFNKMPDRFTRGLMAGIIGFEMEVERLEGKFKLGQERGEPDRERTLRNLRSSKQERSMHDFSASLYERIRTAGKTSR